MKVLINKNILFIRRNIISSIICFSIPIAIAILMKYFFGFIQWREPKVENRNGTSETFDPFVYQNETEYITDVGIISSQDTTAFEKFLLLKEFCNHKFCNFKHYATKEDFDIAQKNYSVPQLLFHLDKEGDKERIKLLYQSWNYRYESIFESMNLLLFDYTHDRRVELLNIQTLIGEYSASVNGAPLKNQILINKRSLYTAEIYTSFSSVDIRSIGPIFLTFMLLPITAYYLNQIMHEKESKLTDLLFRQGVNEYSYWSSWLLSYFLFSLIPILIISIILTYGVFNYINFFIIFISIQLFSINLFGFIFIFQACFNKAKTAQMLINVVYFLVLLFSYLMTQSAMPIIVKSFFMIFPQFIHVVNLEILALLDNFKGVTWSLINTPYNGVSLFAIFFIYLLNFVIYIALGWGIMKIKELGITKLLQRKKKDNQRLLNPLFSEKDSETSAPRTKVNHEEITDSVQLEKKRNNQLLSIYEATKTYEEVQAVKRFTGDMHYNQIFCLLGHNGAGKTTLIKMISGMEDADSGDVMLDGHSLIQDKNFLYKNIGLCGQDNLFFDYMTVSENLELMCKLKGERANIHEIIDLLVKIQLIDKKECIARTLSGGHKRKLCIALALIGRSKLILLDEPTSGMDVIAKRALWDFLKGYKKNKIIILTTHSLDEAEYLGDRIGIMSEGQYICSGTSPFLKNKYSCGYNINFLGDSSKFTKDIKLKFVHELKEIEPSSIIKSLSKEVLSVNFITINENTNAIFDRIDTIKHSYFIENYTVSTTSLEDVFLKLNSSELSKDLFNETNDVPIEINQDQNQLAVTSGLCSQFWINIKRTILPLWRNKSSLFPELLVSFIIFFIFFIAFNQVSEKSVSFQNINSVLSKNTIYFYSLVPESRFNINDLKSNHILSNGITLERLPNSVNITQETTPDEMAANLYKWSTYKNERAVIVITETEGKLIFNLFYQMSAKNYFTALTNLITSHFLTKETKKEYLFLSENAQIVGDEYSQKAVDFGAQGVAALILWFCFVNFGGYIIETPVQDKESNLKHLLFLSGANMTYYWLSHFVVDFLKYCLLVLIVLPFLLLANYMNGLLLFIAIGYIFASNVMMYCFSFALKRAESGRQIYLIVMIVGSFALSTRLIFSIVKIGFNLSTASKFLIGFKFYEVDILPASSFLFGMIRLIGLNYFKIEDKILFTQCWNIMAVFFIQIVCFSLLLYLLEIKVIQKAINQLVLYLTKDSFLEEQQILIAQEEGTQPLLDQQNPQEYYKREEMNKANAIDTTTAIRGITKTFCSLLCKKNKAVNNLYMGLKANEKFGLLGFNGSGKTTTFKAIIQDLFFDSGTISLFGYDIETNFNSIRTFIGYCPQENALFDYLTVRETFHYFKTLKRLRLSEEDICQQFGLAKYINAYCKNLSGGNKRKLCFAIALMSHPKLLLLDEPSTGVDPESRRVMWKSINDISKHRAEYNMILSTHSMEEAEILCDTVGWLKKGSFLCVGNPEKLKQQFSNGYRFHVKCTFLQESALIETELKNLISTLPYPQILNTYTQPEYRAHFSKIDSVIGAIIPYCSSIQLISINQDKSIDFNIQLKPDCQGKLFSLILTYTKTDKEISEITIDMQSLEKIMTSFEKPDGDFDLFED